MSKATDTRRKGRQVADPTEFRVVRRDKRRTRTKLWSRATSSWSRLTCPCASLSRRERVSRSVAHSCAFCLFRRRRQRGRGGASHQRVGGELTSTRHSRAGTISLRQAPRGRTESQFVLLIKNTEEDDRTCSRSASELLPATCCRRRASSVSFEAATPRRLAFSCDRCRVCDSTRGSRSCCNKVGLMRLRSTIAYC